MSYADDFEEAFSSQQADPTVSPVFDEDAKSRLALQMLKHMHQSLTHVIQLMEEGDTSRATRDMVNFVMGKKQLEQSITQETGARMIEGVFDGVFMVTSEGARHAVPENYASKSKLVEGDMMKLIMKADGRHVYKQIGPVERMRKMGVLGTDPVTNNPIVIAGDDVYKVLAASVSYHKGAPGDEVVVLVPGSGRSAWAALERIVR